MSSSASSTVGPHANHHPSRNILQDRLWFEQSGEIRIRLVCRDINQRTLDDFGPHVFRSGHIVGQFNHEGFCRLLKIAHHRSGKRFDRDVRLPVTRQWRILGSPRSSGWKRDSAGYIARPDQVYEICALKRVMKMLSDCKQFRLMYDINENKKRRRQRSSLKFTIETILAICAAGEVNIKGIELSDHKYSAPAFTVNQDRPLRPWDKSKPLLDTACALIPALRRATTS
jgi:hypothetical protein